MTFFSVRVHGSNQVREFSQIPAQSHRLCAGHTCPILRSKLSTVNINFIKPGYCYTVERNKNISAV